MKTVKVLELDLISQKEGNATFTFLGFKPSQGRILAFREKGSISGNHWHEGNSEAKNPEEILLIKGNLRLDWTTDLEGTYSESTRVQAPALIRIYPLVKHRIEALEDLCFLEFNSLEEHAQDTKYPGATN